MSRSSPASTSHYTICPRCESPELQLVGGQYSACCSACGYVPSLAVQVTLQQIVALPDALGTHACECGHPEMRHLPDGVFYCPACGSEVLPLEASSALSTQDPSEARRRDRSDRCTGRTEGGPPCTRMPQPTFLGTLKEGGA